ncbi:MAG: TetR family transcriptional regulator [Leptospiraceae bacterium]|nr:TetR family transcriptional regulator [Leptospiraceae bacterium]
MENKTKLQKLDRKETEKSKKTKELIYSTAISLFQKESYEKATMRLIASKADIALGATYYHFKTKEDIVLYFYTISQDDAKLQSLEFSRTTEDFKLRLKNIIVYKIDYFSKYRNFVSVLAKNAGDPNHPLSPFSKETKEIREEAIQIIRDALETSNLNLKEEVSFHLPELLWLYQMGIIYYWISDTSKAYKNTNILIEESLDLVFKLIKLSKLPFFKTTLSSIFKIIRLIKGV